MKSFIKKICIGLVLAGVISSEAFAVPVSDMMRGMEKTLENVDRIVQSISEKMKNANLEDQIKTWNGTVDVTTKPSWQIYDYLLNTPFNTLPSSHIGISQSDMAAAREFVRRSFFVPDGATDSEKNFMRALRRKYVSLLAQEQLTLANGIRDQVANDMKTAQNSEGSGGGILQEIQLDTQTIRALTMLSAANVIMGIKMMELDAAEMLLSKDVVLKEKPAGNGK